MNPVDLRGCEYAVGQTVVKADAPRGRAPGLKMREVIRVEDGQVWLNGVHPRPLLHPEYCMIVAAA